jgi:hypothetical protein
MESVSLVPVSELMPRVERTLGPVTARLRALVPGAGLHHIGATALPGALTKATWTSWSGWRPRAFRRWWRCWGGTSP